MNSQSYFSSSQHRTSGATAPESTFPSSHRTNPHFYHQYLQQQQQQRRRLEEQEREREWRCVHGCSGQDSGTGTGTHVPQNQQPTWLASEASEGRSDGGDPLAPRPSAAQPPRCTGLLRYPDHQLLQESHHSNDQLTQQQPGAHLHQRIQLQQQQQQPPFLHPSPHHHHQQQQQQRWLSGCSGLTPAEEPAEELDHSRRHSWMAQSFDRLPPATSSKYPDSPPDSGSEPLSPPTTSSSAADPATATAALVARGSSMATVTSSHIIMDSRVTPHQHPLHQGHGPPYHHPEAHQAHHHHHHQQQTLGPIPFSKGHFGFYGGAMEQTRLSVDLSPPRLGAVSMVVDQHEIHPPYHHSSLQNQPPKKRKFTDSPPGTLSAGGGGGGGGVLVNPVGVGNTVHSIKPEPYPADLRYGLAPDCSEDDSFGYDYPADGGMFVDGMYQVIKWTTHQPTQWATLVDENRQELAGFNYRVDADKGFNFSPSDDAFVCQKKNHFQITAHISVSTFPKCVRLPESPTIVPVEAFYLHFYGIKMESPSQTIKIEQSQSDRSKKLFNPVKVDLYDDQVQKLTVGRLHFSETTSNNMRKKGKPNPDQRYFQLVVALEARLSGGGERRTVAAHASERIIVRFQASNPGQFESDSEVVWSKGKLPEAIFHAGRVGINTDTPDEALTVHGNVKVTGHVISPSDVRVKKDFSEIDTREQLKNIAQLKVYKYTFKDDFAEFAGLSDDDRLDTGVLAQEVSQVLPDAVRETGDVLLPGGQRIDNFLVVNKDRIFIENVGAVKELCKVTGKLENRITEIELINKKLAKCSKTKKTGSVTSSGSSVFTSGESVTNSSLSRSMSNASSVAKPASMMKHCTRHRHHHHHQQQQQQRDLRHDGSTRPGVPGAGAAQGQRLAAGGSSSSSGKAIQVVVITLVVIMAICLLSITVLYVLDRKNVPQPSPALNQEMQSTSRQNTTTVSMTTVSWPGSSSVRPPLIPLQCIEKPSNCPLRCCDPTTESPPDDPDHPPIIIITAPPSSTTKKWNKKTKSPNDIDYNEEIDDFPDGNFPEVPLPSIWSDFKSTAAKKTTDEHLSQKQVPKRNNEVNRTPKNSTKNNFKVTKKRSKRDDVASSAQMALVFIKQLNETLSPAYCVSADCRAQWGGNYSYSVPVSRHFPPLFVTLQFVPLAVNPDVTVTMCSETETSLCSDSSHEDSDYVTYQVSAYEWDLPVGFYSRLIVKFRLTATTVRNVCELPDTAVGKTFAEYSMNFYRKCS